jgi:peptidyl-prolyl cis-trans isomerase SurA
MPLVLGLLNIIGVMKCTRVLGMIVLGVSLSCAADIALVEEIVAKVNGDIITRGEVDRGRKQVEADLRQQGVKGGQLQQAMDEAAKNVLRDKIDNLLLIQKGKELNINVDTEVTKYIADLQKRSKIADPEKFQQYVREQTGMSYEDFKSETKNGMLTQRVIRQEVAPKINVKKEELKKYYDEHKAEFMRTERVFLREILVSTEGKDEAQAEKKAKDLAARAAKGEKFPELARDNSDSKTAEQGGEMPAFDKGVLLKEVEDAVWDKPRGYVTQPLKVPNGFLILKVDDHQKAGQADFEEVENEITDKVFSPRMQPAVREYLTKLRQQAFLEIKPGYIDSGASAGKDTTWNDPAQLKPETVTKEQVASQTRRKKLLWIVPIPGTETKNSKASSSKQ